MAVLSETFSVRRVVLVSGGVGVFQNYSRYLNDLTAFYGCLVGSRYGFDPSSIQVVYANGGNYEMAGHSVTTVMATQKNVEDAIKYAILGDPAKNVPKLTDRDLFIFMTSNHGDSTTSPHRLLLWTPKEFLDTDDLGAALAVGKSQNHYSLGVFGHCWGGDCFQKFLANTPKNRSIVVAASKGASYALDPDNAYDAFAYHFTAALAGATPSGYHADSDANRDGHVDVKEAFEFAKKMDTTKDTPVIDGDSVLAAKLTLEGIL